MKTVINMEIEKNPCNRFSLNVEEAFKSRHGVKDEIANL